MKHLKFTSVAILFALAFCFINASAADNKQQTMTQEFCDEGIQKAVDCFNEMATKIDEIETVEQLQELEQIMNSMKMRNVRKKYGKIELTDEYRQRLIDANIKIAKSMTDMTVRLNLPYEVRAMLEANASPEKITQGVNEAKTLREVME